jgi:hypothetical protein
MKALHSDAEFTLNAAGMDTARESGWRSVRSKRSSPASIALIAAFVLVLAGIAGYFLWQREPSMPAANAPVAATSDSRPGAPAASAIEHPVERIPTTPDDNEHALPPLPGLDASDVVARDSIATVLNGDDFLRLLVPAALIRHIVATVDNLPRQTIAIAIRPVKPAPGPFVTAKDTRGTSIASDNAARYIPYVTAVEAINAERLAGFYVRLYPLFQQAYVELGYPNGYFNDRLIGVIDHLLAAPEPKAPVYLAQPRIAFEFADPQLESLSAGQKVLVRMGADNEMRIKAKLRELRKLLASGEVHR